MLACSIVLAGISVKSLISDMIHDMLHVKLKTVRKDRRSRERKGCYVMRVYLEGGRIQLK